MTTKSQTLTVPKTLQLGRLVIAAGQSGHPVCAFFRGYPPETLAAIWRFLAHAAGPNRALHVHGLTEVRKVEKKPGSFGLLLLHDPKRFGPATWAIDAGRCKSKAHPSMVSEMNVRNHDAAPLPYILLDAGSGEINELMRFFTSIGGPTTHSIDPRLIAPDVESLKYEEQRGYFSDPPPSLNDRRMLFAVLCGACLLRHSGKGSSEKIRVERSDAAYLYKLLESQGVATSLSRGARESLRSSKLP